MRVAGRTILLATVLILCGGLLAGDPSPEVEIAEFDGHRYQLFDDVEDLSWQGARDRCVEAGGHLVVIDREAEFEFIASLCDGRYMYLGASDADEEGLWTWVDGTEWAFERWMKGQPNNYGGGEDFLATYKGGEWVDVEASGGGFWMPTGYICEWDELPTSDSGAGS
ncbi:MAG: hypothetical protein OEV00_03495 [Acidobacteriota bacterium]|nr:hypothetical protein [Acidobacteriota bacterium]MDH3784375.1 hypothetical protein [Acidobacteriota bacterium]